MLWVLKEPSQRDGSFEYSQHMMFNLVGKKIFANLRSKFCLSKHVYFHCVFLAASWVKVLNS